eukprot:TRINITY_DN15065_c0_g1_i2.p1 TRINITY_DN15065_c0_g1~~TRINITY_DN15065_c0_g1_i2.p1  ORF type:complete len:521 (-),score=138.44 TRINITY_DN15065_c0_g1_i2:46-1608(-)
MCIRDSINAEYGNVNLNQMAVRRGKIVPMLTVRATMASTGDSVTMQLPETQSVFHLKKKVLLLTQDDVAVSPNQLEISVAHNQSEFVLEDEHIIRDIPYDNEGCCTVRVRRRRPPKKAASQSSRATAEVPLQERIERITGEFEHKFKSAVAFRLDDFLWEQEALQEQRKCMRERLKEELDVVADKHNGLLERVDETKSLRKALIEEKLKDRREEALHSLDRKLQRQQNRIEGKAMQHQSPLDIEREQVSRRLRERAQFRTYVFGGGKYLIWVLLFTLFVFYFREDGYYASELLRNQFLGMGDLKTAKQLTELPQVNVIPQLFWTMRSMDQMWDWINGTFLPATYADRYNSTAQRDSEGDEPLFQWSSKVIGSVRLRQLRTVDDACQMLENFNGYIPRCYLPYREDVESKRAFGESGQYQWRSASELGGDRDVYTGKDGTEYPGSGFVVDLPTNLEASREMIRLLNQSRWVDQATRVVFVDINTCLLYTSDAADEEDSVDLGGRRIITKKKQKRSNRNERD